MKIAFIGLGNMGLGIARNLLRAGHQLTAFNRTRAKAEALQPDGAQVAASPAEAARNAEVVMTMLADDAAVEEVVFGEGRIAEAMPSGAVHVSHSTISTAMARRLTTEHARRGQLYISAPVFGRPEAAEAKKLVVVVAGPEAAVGRCQRSRNLQRSVRNAAQGWGPAAGVSRNRERDVRVTGVCKLRAHHRGQQVRAGGFRAEAGIKRYAIGARAGGRVRRADAVRKRDSRSDDLGDGTRPR